MIRHPDPAVIKLSLADFGNAVPSGYGIDFGVLTDGRTVLGEVNDGYALGSCGLNSIEDSERPEAK